MRKSREFEDTTISMLDVPTVYKIVDIIANSMPLGSDKTKEIRILHNGWWHIKSGY